MSQYFTWKDCVKTATQQATEENLQRERMEAARPCLAADIPRMEALLAPAIKAVKPEWTLEEARRSLSAVIGFQGAVQIANDNIKERVLVFSIYGKCDAPFHFLVNVREASDRKLRWITTWAEDPPDGYPGGAHPEFSINFEKQRQEEAYRAEAAQREQADKESMDKVLRDIEEQRQNALRRVKISDAKMTCMGAGPCTMRILDFTLTNVSPAPVKNISLGWMFLSPQMPECPAKMATKEQKYGLVLQPGETAHQRIVISDAPENVGARYCVRVTEIGSFYP